MKKIVLIAIFLLLPCTKIIYSQYELITNGGFESSGSQSASSWVFRQNSPGFYIGNWKPHLGNKYAYLGANINGDPINNTIGVLAQSVFIPNGTINGSLGFWLYISTEETSGSDYMGIYLDGKPIGGFSSLDATGGYVWKSFLINDLSSYQGKYIELTFSGNSNGSKPTVFRIDDVSFIVAVASVPVANFVGTPTSGNAPLTVSFSDQSSGTITSRSWNFGDGATSTAQNPSHIYNSSGTYTVSLSVSGQGGSDTETKTNYITVNSAAPVANFVGTPTSGNAPLTVSFSDQSSGTITSRSWNFGDGATSTAQNPSHIYNSSGTYTVSLSVSGQGGSDTETKTNYITVNQQLTNIIIGNLKISGDQITGSSPNYTITGHIKIGHINQNEYLIQDLDGTLTCNTNTNNMTVTSGGSSFKIKGTQGWTWEFFQTQNWSFNPTTGKAVFKSQIKLSETGNIYFQSNYLELDIFNYAMSGVIKYYGLDELQSLASFEANINLMESSFGVKATIGTEITLGQLRLGIIPNTLGISFNLVNKKFSFDGNIGHLATLQFVDIDGLGFSYSPLGSFSLGFDWDFLQKKILFTRDSQIGIPINNKQTSDSHFKELFRSEKIYYDQGLHSNQMLLSVGLTIKKGSYFDYGNNLLVGEGSIDIGWHIGKFNVSAAKIDLNINSEQGKIFGQIRSPGIKIAENLKPDGWFNSNDNAVSYSFFWKSLAKYAFSGLFNSLIYQLYPSIDAKVESIINENPSLTGTLQSCISWGPYQWCPTAEIKISQEGLRINGNLLSGGGFYSSVHDSVSKLTSPHNKTTSGISISSSSHDSVTVLANPYNKTVSGVFLNETVIPQTNISVKPLSYFNIIYDSTATNYGDLHLSSIMDGNNLSWNYHINNYQISAGISNFEGLSMALASSADLKVQSSLNINKYMEVKNNGEIIVSNFNNGFSYYSPDSTKSIKRIWKVIRIYPEDTTEIFNVIVSPTVSSDPLLFTLIKTDKQLPGKVIFARYYSGTMNNNSYTLKIAPNVMNYSFTNGNDAISPNSLDNVHIENGLFYLSQMHNLWTESSFRIMWKSSVPSRSIVRFGPTISEAINSQSSNQMTTDHDVFIPRISLDSGWVYQIQGINSDSESVYSEWRFIYPGSVTSALEEVKIPIEYSLYQNYPNPFNPSTKIKYSIPKTSFVTLKLFDMLGREVKTLVCDEQKPGYYELNFNSANLASGVYIYRICAGNFISEKKFILLK